MSERQRRHRCPSAAQSADYTLILDANDLFDVLNDRRFDIVGLLANTSAVARELSGLMGDNEKALAPALEKSNAVTAVLEENRDNIGRAPARVDDVSSH